jgi:hypothetical protein
MADHFPLFVSQTSLQITYKHGREALINLLFEQDIWWRIVLLSYLFLSSLSFIYGWIKRYPIFLFGSLATILTLGAILFTVDQWYFVYLPFFPFILCILFAREGMTYPYTRQRILFLLPLLFNISIHAIGSIPGIQNHRARNEAYEKFTLTIADQIPLHSVVALSSIPDPYFILRKRPDLTLYQIPHVTEPGKLAALLDQSTVIIHNYATNPELLPYITQHTEKKITVNQEDGYQTEIIFLKK